MKSVEANMPSVSERDLDTKIESDLISDYESDPVVTPVAEKQ